MRVTLQPLVTSQRGLPGEVVSDVYRNVDLFGLEIRRKHTSDRQMSEEAQQGVTEQHLAQYQSNMTSKEGGGVETRNGWLAWIL